MTAACGHGAHFDRNMEIWEYGCMRKTTLELPDELMRRVKLRAVHRNQKLKDAITQLLEIGMASCADVSKAPKAPKPLRLKGRRQLSMRDIEAAIGGGRD
jgi:hypothetical protein